MNTTHHMSEHVLADIDESARRLADAGFTVGPHFVTRHGDVVKVPIAWRTLDLGCICFYPASKVPTPKFHEVRIPAFQKAAEEACFGDGARATALAWEAEDLLDTSHVRYHAHVASKAVAGTAGKSCYTVLVGSKGRLGAPSSGRIDGSPIEAEAAGVTSLIGQCETKGVESVAVHASLQLRQLAEGETRTGNVILREFVEAVRGARCRVVWLPRDKEARGFVAARYRVDRFAAEVAHVHAQGDAHKRAA